MTNLKNFYLNENVLKLYQAPLFERILYLYPLLGLIEIPLIMLSVEKFTWLVLPILLIFSLYGLLVYFIVFKVYICLDLSQGQLIIREFPGFKQQTIPLDNIQEIRFCDNSEWRTFSIDIVCDKYTKSIISWSSGFSARIVFFCRYLRQKERLLKFTQECNEILEKNRPTQTTLNP